MEKRTGRCLCGAVEFSTSGPMRPVIACHCSQCRRWSGNFWAATACQDGDLTIESGNDLVTWFRSSDFAKRAFCGKCGSTLFYKADGIPEFADKTSIGAGLFDGETHFEHGRHIFCKDRGDYYEFPDNAELIERY
ncbi:MAG: GFA family protein [Stappiaceae bacterium]